MEKKKIGLLGAILMGIGCIVGSGIFGTLPTVANEYGAGVVWALIGAAVVVVLRALALTYSSAALPASGAQFLWAAKLIHPAAGAFISFGTLLMPTMVSLFGVLFGMYVQPLFPNTEINSTIAAVALLVVFAVVAWFGNKTAINTGNVMVVLLLIAIVLYIVLGLPNIDASNVTFGEIVRPGVTFSSLAAAIGVLTSSLSGASSVAQVADDVKNPGRTVPLALILCPAIVAVVYILMAIVTIGVVPAAEVTSLSDVASHFMSPVLLTFFIVGGPICGIITSLIQQEVRVGRQLEPRRMAQPVRILGQLCQHGPQQAHVQPGAGGSGTAVIGKHHRPPRAAALAEIGPAEHGSFSLSIGASENVIRQPHPIAQATGCNLFCLPVIGNELAHVFTSPPLQTQRRSGRYPVCCYKGGSSDACPAPRSRRGTRSGRTRLPFPASHR